MALHVPRIETSRVRNPPDDLSPVVLPALAPCSHPSEMEGKKTGAALMISGVLLALLGVTFTTMGWQDYKSNSNFELIQLLGPVLISVGGTFVLTSVCKFPMMSCCKSSMEEAPVMEQTSPGQSLTFANASNPVLLHGTTAMLRLPPAYSFITQEVHRPIGGSVNGVHAGSPPYDAVFCVGNSAFTAGEEEGGSGHCTGDNRRRRWGKPEEEEEEHGDGGGSSASLRPPAYEDIFPSFNKNNPT